LVRDIADLVLDRALVSVWAIDMIQTGRVVMPEVLKHCPPANHSLAHGRERQAVAATGLGDVTRLGGGTPFSTRGWACLEPARAW